MSVGGVIADIASEITKGAHHSATSTQEGAKSFGKSAFEQLFGVKSENSDLRHDEIAKKRQEDEKFSREHEQYVKNEYAQYYAQKKKQEEMEKQQMKQQEEEAKKIGEINERKVNKQKEAQVRKAIETSSAEMRGKYGNE